MSKPETTPIEDETNSESDKALKIEPDGTVTVVNLVRDRDRSTLKWLYDTINCHYVEVVRCQRIDPNSPNTLDMWIDEEGTMHADPVRNPVANSLLDTLGVQIIGAIHGVAVLTESTPSGETVGLRPTTLAALLKVTEMMADATDE